MDTDELLPLLGRYTLLILNPRFTEQSLNAAEHTDLELTAAWVGRTIGTMQIWDVLRAVKWAKDDEKIATSSIAIYGKGDMGILALYAALFEPRIDEVILNEPPASHWQRPALLNVLRVTDIPEVAGAFARVAWFRSRSCRANSITRRIYELAGAPGSWRTRAACPKRWKCGSNPGTDPK